MTKDENIHSGHRERIIKRLLASPDSFSDHELLEVLLFSVVKRKDTNALAHKILRTFGSLEKVFNASSNELRTVDGVGERIASELVVVGSILRKIGLEKKKSKPIYSFAKNKKELAEDFAGINQEIFIIYLLDAGYKIITQIKFEDYNSFSVMVDLPDLAKAIAIHKPKYVIMAHNHPSGIALPSKADDNTTKKIFLLCNLHGVRLIDHIIVAKDGAYSYYTEGSLERIKENVDLDELLTDKGVFYE